MTAPIQKSAAKIKAATQIITGNRVTDGVVVYLDRAGGWTERLNEARVAEGAEDLEAALALGKQAEAAQHVVEAYPIDVARGTRRPASAALEGRHPRQGADRPRGPGPPLERVRSFGMYRYDEFDHAFVQARVAQFADQVERRLSGELTEDQFQPAAADERRLPAASRLHAADRGALRHAVARSSFACSPTSRAPTTAATAISRPAPTCSSTGRR